MRRATSQTTHNKESNTSTRLQPRTRDDKKITSSDAKQKTTTNTNSTNASEETMDVKSNTDDVYEFKSVKDDGSSPEKATDGAEVESEPVDPLSITPAPSEETPKRNFSEVDPLEENGNDEETKRKKRKDDNTKETTTKTTQRNTGQGKGQGNKQTGTNQKTTGSTTNAKSATTTDKKSPCNSPKPSNSNSDPEADDGKTDLKVPPLKIVIPQGTSAEPEVGTSRNGKNSSQRAHQALPYVVASSNSNDSSDKDMVGGTASPENAGNSKDGSEKKENASQNEEQRGGGSGHQRVLRSSHRSGGGGGGQPAADRASNSSSPLQHSPSPSASSASASPAAASNQADIPTATGAATYTTNAKAVDSQASQNAEVEPSTSSSSGNAPTPAPPSSEIHPRKRKFKQSKEQPAAATDTPETAAETREVHPHDQPITNCYRLYLNIRKQIEKRRKGLFPVQPKPPQGFKDYLMNRCTYVLSGTAPTTPNITYPANLSTQMKDLFTEQEKERYRLRMQHVIEKEKLVLSVEQEILRVHGRAARALANQSLPFSVCTILRDEEVYNLITPEQEEKDRNARSRYNGRLFLSWLQDVDDKWEKIKEHMLLRHHNEAESLHAVQKMNWEWKMKEHNLCDRKTTPKIEEVFVPMVHVSDDFDLLPA